MTTSKQTLIAKIAAASLKVGALATDKRNEQQRYDYISADKVLERAGDALAEAGVVVVPSITVENTEVVKTDKGGTRYDCVVHFAMILSDGESQLEMPWVGRGSDYSVPDKALYKAITSGHKYFLMKLLNIGVGNEDGEHENEPQPQAKKPLPSASADEVFENKRERATKEAVAELKELGMEFYKGEWDEQAPKLAEAVSTGVTNDIHKLMPVEVTKLVNGIKRKMALVNAEVAK